jgi:NADH:ubiquinone oxidoreductase subunit
MYLSLAAWIWLSAAATNPDPTQMRRLYHNGVATFQKGQFAASNQSFLQLLPQLQKVRTTRKKGTRARHMMTLGICDVLYYQAKIAASTKAPRRSCRLYAQLIQEFQSVPATWSTWNVYPNLPAHMKEARTAWNKVCPGVPSLVRYTVAPSNATVSLKAGDAWRPVKSPFETSNKKLTLRIAAKGFETKVVKGIVVPRWSRVSLSYQLAKKKVIVAVRRPPAPRIVPKPKALTSEPWFWGAVIGGGVLVAGGVVAAVVAANQPKEYAFQCQSGGAFRAWGSCSP